MDRGFSYYLYLFNLGIAFLLELCLPVIYAVAGVHFSGTMYLKILMGMTIPIIVIFVWWKFYAPKSPARLKEPMLLWAKVAIFSLAVVILILTGYRLLAVIFGVVTAGNLILMYSYGSNNK